MEVLLIDTHQKSEVYGKIQLLSKSKLPKRKDGWKFTWSKLYENNAFYYGVIYEGDLQGVLKLTYTNEEFIDMSNLELAPLNYGSTGKFERVVGCLIAYACLKSFELGKGNYKGYLSFKSKGELIDHYIKKYKAELVFRDMMIISPANGLLLIKKYLNMEL